MVDTIEEAKLKEEEARKAQEAAAAAAAAAPSDETPLGDADTSKYTAEEKDAYIDKLKYENAKRRIRAKDATKAQVKDKDALKKANVDLEEATKKLTDLEKKKEDEELKDASAYEKERKKVSNLEETVKDLEKEKTTTSSQLKKKESQLQIKNREFTVERLMNRLGLRFSSTFERDGFLQSVTKVDNDGQFSMTDEEAILEVKEFVKHSKTPPDTPGSGPDNRKTEMPLAKEIEVLLAKTDLTEEDSKRLDELVEQVE